MIERLKKELSEQLLKKKRKVYGKKTIAQKSRTYMTKIREMTRRINFRRPSCCRRGRARRTSPASATCATNSGFLRLSRYGVSHFLLPFIFLLFISILLSLLVSINFSFNLMCYITLFYTHTLLLSLTHTPSILSRPSILYTAQAADVYK